MKKRTIFGISVLVLLALVLISYWFLSGPGADPLGPNLNTTGNETTAGNITRLSDEENKTPLAETPDETPDQTPVETIEDALAARNITLSNEEDAILLTQDTDLAAFARERMNSHGVFQEELAGTVPGEPVYVYSLDEKLNDYYLIPFEKDGYIAVIATVTIMDDIALFGSVTAPSIQTKDVVRPTLEEAREVLSERGHDDDLDARLVWKPCLQTMSRLQPVWEFSNDDGETWYVCYSFDDTIEVYDELTEKTRAG
ncbi:hypothetical protein RJ40_01330 [Methanofollis aquaemaris]|uniref:Uncharacterized protein n=1 Tax=Methanofollis aquaemaris TaxID=126734 RepID=A0A8A3S2S7_9EURY|nr:hypothetical protein [Methanofollis aquaemaris]QSZ66233.1 hypothetical protein RJ40_01330 [Methanofollis aquaemaris]